MTEKTWDVKYRTDGNRRMLVLPQGTTAKVIKFQGQDWVEIIRE